MCSEPVTFGGGSAMLKCGRCEAASVTGVLLDPLGVARARGRAARCLLGQGGAAREDEERTSAVRRARQPDTRRAAVCAANVAANLLTPPTVLVEVAVRASSLIRPVHARFGQPGLRTPRRGG